MYRKQWQPEETFTFRRATLRGLTAVALVGYPLGALLNNFSAEGSFANLFGGLIAPLAAMLGLLALGSQAYRIIHARPSELDEFELAMRYRAMTKAYGALSALVILGAIYFYHGTDLGAWVPRTADEWRGVMFGALLAALLLPTTILVWSNEIPDDDDEEEQ